MPVLSFFPSEAHLITDSYNFVVDALFGFSFKGRHLIKKIKLMKGKALRKHSLHGKTAASVLLKLYISGYDLCHPTDAP